LVEADVMAAKVKRCGRCNRRLRGAAVEWVCDISLDDDGLGAVTEVYCPKCATDGEHMQREINDATTDYVWYGERVARHPKQLPEFQPAALN
jgi:hypothetical protein